MTTTLDTRTTSPTRGAALTAAVAGPLLLVLSFLQSSSDGPPPATATAAQIRAWAADQATALRIGAFGAVASVIVLLVFTAALARLVRAAHPESLLAGLGAGAGEVLALCLLITVTADSLPVILPGLVGADLSTTDDRILLGWWATAGLTHLLGDFQMALIATVVGAFSIAARRGGLVPRWIVWAGLAITASAVLGTAAVTLGIDPLYGFWFGGMFGWVLWMAVAGVALGLRQRGAARRAA